jgi:hypothetical protein
LKGMQSCPFDGFITKAPNRLTLNHVMPIGSPSPKQYVRIQVYLRLDRSLVPSDALRPQISKKSEKFQDRRNVNPIQ